MQFVLDAIRSHDAKLIEHEHGTDDDLIEMTRGYECARIGIPYRNRPNSRSSLVQDQEWNVSPASLIGKKTPGVGSPPFIQLFSL